MDQDYKKPPRGSMLINALKLCEKMSSAAIEMRLIMRLSVLVEEYGTAYRALREPAAVKSILDIDEELIEHAQPSLRRAILAAVDAAAETFVEVLDKDGWREVLLVALEVDDPPANVIPFDAYRYETRGRRTNARASFAGGECNGEYDDEDGAINLE